MAGKLVAGAGNLLAAVYLEKMDRWSWLLVYMIPQNLSGGELTFIMMTYSFIADNSTPRYSNQSYQITAKLTCYKWGGICGARGCVIFSEVCYCYHVCLISKITQPGAPLAPLIASRGSINLHKLSCIST